MEKNIIEVPCEPIAVSDEEYSENGYVRLPYKDNEFKEFITSLLGEPQSIDGIISGKFNITVSDVDKLHQFISQRIQTQNKGRLIQFVAKVAYNDKSMITLNSLNDFLTYNEIKPLVPTALHITWTYLIKFPEKEYPEKQRISVSFISGKFYRKMFDIDFFTSAIRSGVVEYKIQHTSRSWGVDIENLLTNRINSIIEKPKKLHEILSKKKTLISFSFSSIICIGVFYTLAKKVSFYRRTELSNVNADMERLMDNLNAKLDYVMEYIASGSVNRYNSILIIAGIVSIITSVVLAFWLQECLDIGEQSHILLTDESKKDKEKDDKAEKNNWRKLILTIVSSILTGIAGSFIYDFLIRK
ncbi:hypothetical protein [Clostridium intestinale]|uniref:Uncharacterized protein n=1 Tax=Clostridium intestinale TaxID=36845 RepID=A0A7D7A0Z0_9CLOT|nr:hypothetical protein [Clostridium intestinale]QLY78058.1 hypothetical protein HZF06_13245 [Clostridium intestinale]